jgi:hypothetical protein
MEDDEHGVEPAKPATVRSIFILPRDGWERAHAWTTLERMHATEQLRKSEDTDPAPAAEHRSQLLVESLFNHTDGGTNPKVC